MNVQIGYGSAGYPPGPVTFSILARNMARPVRVAHVYLADLQHLTCSPFFIFVDSLLVPRKLDYSSIRKGELWVAFAFIIIDLVVLRRLTPSYIRWLQLVMYSEWRVWAGPVPARALTG